MFMRAAFGPPATGSPPLIYVVKWEVPNAAVQGVVSLDHTLVILVSITAPQ